MTKREAAEILKTDSCSECTYVCESAVTCKNEKCAIRKATEMAIEALEEVERNTENAKL